jgi:hypothetical protein
MNLPQHIAVVIGLLSAHYSVAQGLYISEGITMTAREGNIQLRGNWVNNGSFLQRTGVITFAGDTQTVRGSKSTVFNDLTVVNGSKATMATAGQGVRGVVLSNGILYANDNLSLLSSASQTALVDGAGTGEVLGNLTMQRYLYNSLGYKYISAPFQSATVNEMADEVNLSSTFPNFYKYHENRQSAGWVSLTDPGSLLIPFHGYAVNLGTSLLPITAAMTGVANNGQFSLTLYNHNQPFTKGFNLVGNPYPSPVDWDIAEGWSRNNVDNAVYYFNAGTANRYKGTYSSYINGISSDGFATGVVPAMQGFFVHVSDGVFPVTGTLTINNKARVNNLSPYYHKTAMVQMKPLIRLKAGFVEHKHVADPLVVYFDERASDNFESELDALKVLNTDERVPNFYVLSGAQRLSVSALSTFTDTIAIIPLGLTTELEGWISFDTVSLQNLPYGVHPYFVDVKTGVVQDIQKQPRYWVMLPNGTYDNRFCLVFSRADPSKHPFFGDVFNAWAYNGRLHLTLNMLSGGKGEVMITSTSGQTLMKTAVNGFGHHEIDAPWAAGVYIVSLVNSEGTFSKKIIIAN